jgi:hypothetical protein
MLVNIVYPSGLTSPRGSLFNFDWITLVVMLVLLVIGAVYFFAARPDRRHTAATPSGSAEPLPSPSRPAVDV